MATPISGTAAPKTRSNIHGKQFIDCFYAYHTGLSPERAAVGEVEVREILRR